VGIKNSLYKIWHFFLWSLDQDLDFELHLADFEETEQGIINNHQKIMNDRCKNCYYKKHGYCEDTEWCQHCLT
jgi:hypothetical protein